MRYQGIIIQYDQVKRWGFIQGSSGDIFFHCSNCNFEPELGAAVEYEIGKPFTLGKKPQAVVVRESQPEITPSLIATLTTGVK